MSVGLTTQSMQSGGDLDLVTFELSQLVAVNDALVWNQECVSQSQSLELLGVGQWTVHHCPLLWKGYVKANFLHMRAARNLVWRLGLRTIVDVARGLMPVAIEANTS
ncbi:hypothetical protein VNO77_32923 [Canavalia gladiata]|uniref:Uncharacterized protein n=1 Tax=Canavalia gladiata TaxID=3824 RepID=A0AAN9KCV9_CANGL